MAGIRSNRAWAGFAKQTVKGTPIAAPTYKTAITDGFVQPEEVINQLEETDSLRDAGDSYKSRGGVVGSVEHYVRDTTVGKLFELTLGTRATTGTGPDYTHSYTPAEDIPYATLHEMLGNLLFLQHEDVKINELEVSADAGEPLKISSEVIGRRVTRLTADPAAGVSVATDAPYNFNEAAVSVGGAATSLVSSFSLTYANGVEIQQTDDYVPFDVYAGQREVTVGFDMIFETLDLYNQFHFGTTAGTAQTPTIFTSDLIFTFTKGVNNEIKFTLPAVTIEEYPVEPDAGGNPIEVAVRARAKRSASPVLTIAHKNQIALG